MKRIHINLLLALAVTNFYLPVTAQEAERSSSSIYLQPASKSPMTLTFSLSADGQRYQPTWGMDLAWVNEQNLRKGINHIGKQNIGIGRSSFRTNVAMPTEQTLHSSQISMLKQRATLFNLVSPTLPLILNSDVGAGVDSYYSINKKADISHWAQVINAHTQWMISNTKHPVVGVSPFNEPDYSREQGDVNDFTDIARTLKEDYPLFADRFISGGNTLNCNEATPWYNAMSAYLDYGNTHQLAGSFDSYAAFMQHVSGEGKVACNDEMHNVGEAFVGLEYGMTCGIWWGFDSRARGEFCDISLHGQRIGYAENRSAWQAATAYRHDDGHVKVFLGQSERQAVKANAQLFSTDHEVYFDGYGPTRELTIEMPGGAKGSYQNGQTNAERVIDVEWGDDVRPTPVDGTYKVMNKGTLQVVSISGSSGGNENIAQTEYSGLTSQQWKITPSDPRIGGDFSFHDFVCVGNGKRMDVLNFSTASAANVIAYANDTPSSNEQWYLQYAGNGFYYIRNRESALYLTASSTGTNINQMSKLLANDRQLWRIIPVDATCELEAPAPPQGLQAQEHAAAIELEWTANTETDLSGYMLLRAEQGKENWNTIARQLKGTLFTDNTCRPGHTYIYKVKAIDRSDNQSACSDPVVAAPIGGRSLIAQWDFEQSLQDETINKMDAASLGTPSYSTLTSKLGSHSLSLKGTRCLQLPYEVASSEELTVALWIRWTDATNAWQRIFDFGNGTSQYLFLTPSTGSTMRFAIKNGGEEQTLDCPSKLPALLWKHVAVTIGNGKTTIYVDGNAVASTSAITIKPNDICPSLNYMGRSQFYDDPGLTAYIDDARVYNYALSAEEVGTVMQGGLTTIVETPSDYSQPVRRFGADGRQLPAAQNGLNIIRQSDGTVKKVLQLP